MQVYRVVCDPDHVECFCIGCWRFRPTGVRGIDKIVAYGIDRTRIPICHAYSQIEGTIPEGQRVGPSGGAQRLPRCVIADPLTKATLVLDDRKITKSTSDLYQVRRNFLVLTNDPIVSARLTLSSTQVVRPPFANNNVSEQ